MNKYLLVSWLLLGLFGKSFGQITYTSASFPQAGDVLEISTTLTPVTVTPASATAQTWDFSNFLATGTTLDTIQAASTGSAYASFPSSDILRPFVGNLGGTAYVDVTTSQINRIGGGFELFGLSFIAPYTNSHVAQQAPLTFPNTTSDVFNWAYAAHIDSVPLLRTLLDSLVQLPGGISPDSIRMGIQGDETRTVDAFGSCVMSATTTYNVLRQKVTTDISLKIEVFVPTFGGFGFWFDATPLLGGFLPFPAETRIVRYDFLAEGLKQPLVQLTMDSSETLVVNIEYYSGDPVSIDYIEDELEVNIFPNPAKTSVSIQMNPADVPVDGYYVELVDMLGRKATTTTAIQNENYELPLTDVSNGHYVLLLRDAKGKILKREQLDVLK